MLEKVYSTHILMLPFIFNTEVDKVNQALSEAEIWEYKPFAAEESHENYNEYIYFYEHVRKRLYSSEPMHTQQPIYYFETKEKKGTYSFKLVDKRDEKSKEIIEVGKTYTLSIVGVSMRTFSTGVGVLSIELDNCQYEDANDVLIINDFARRLYPQFLSPKVDKEGKVIGDGLQKVKGALLPEWIEMELGDIKEKEKFLYYTKSENIKKDVTNLPNYIHALLGNMFSSHHQSEKIHIEPIIDDRMFVLSMYINDTLSKNMKPYDEEKSQYRYENDEFWYKFVFVDGTYKTCQSEHMTKKLIKDTTYDRWVEEGTLYGMSRYSFVALTDTWYAENILKPHMRTMYFQMFTLLLAYRASILNFSKRISVWTLQEKEDFDLKKLQEGVSEIYKDYINFQNNLLFREVTAQEQGIEIYEQALRVIQIDKQVKDLDNEIAELHNYATMKAQEEQAQQAEDREQRLAKISVLGAVFLPPSLLAGIYGINIFEFTKSKDALLIGLVTMLFVSVLGYISVKIKKTIVVILAILVMIGAMAGSIYLIGNNDTYKNKKEIKDVRKSDR